MLHDPAQVYRDTVSRGRPAWVTHQEAVVQARARQPAALV